MNKPQSKSQQDELLEFCKMLFEHGREAERHDSPNWGIDENFGPYQKLQSLLDKEVTEARIDELNILVKDWGYGMYDPSDPRYGMDWEAWAEYRIEQLGASSNEEKDDEFDE